MRECLPDIWHYIKHLTWVDLSMVTLPCQVNTVIINHVLKRNRLLERLNKEFTVSSQEVRQSDHSHSQETGLLNMRPSCPFNTLCGTLVKTLAERDLEQKQYKSVFLSLGCVCLSGYISYISLVLCSLVWDILYFFRGYIMT